VDTVRTSISFAWPILALVAATACSARPAPDFGGRWQALNSYDQAARAVPLRRARRFQSLPTDGTLRNLLSRWAHESGRQLHYRLPDDYTLHAPVARIDSERIEEALRQLADAYAAQRVRIVASATGIVVGGEVPLRAPMATGVADVPGSVDTAIGIADR